MPLPLAAHCTRAGKTPSIDGRHYPLLAPLLISHRHVLHSGISVGCHNCRTEFGTLDSSPAKPVEERKILAPFLFADLNRLGDSESARESQARKINNAVVVQRGINDNAILFDPAVLDAQVAVSDGVLKLWNVNAVRLGEEEQTYRTDILVRLYGMGFNLIPMNGKKPCVEGKAYQTRRVTHEDIKEWTTGRFSTKHGKNLWRAELLTFALLTGAVPWPGGNPGVIVLDPPVPHTSVVLHQPPAAQIRSPGCLT